jgi:putative oxidoreductase
MKKIFSTAFPDFYSHLCLLFVRIAAGSFMLTHGLPKLARLTSGEEIKFADPFGLGPAFSLVLVVLAELFCSILIILGLGTRLASIPLIVTMLVAAFHAHADDPFGTKEKPLIFLLIFIVFLVFGSGKYSIDSIVSRK